jgi:hypothetical protein
MAEGRGGYDAAVAMAISGFDEVESIFGYIPTKVPKVS